MDRLEAQRRLFDAIQILIRHGWTQGEVDALITGLQREDAVEAAERATKPTPEELSLQDAYIEGVKDGNLSVRKSMNPWQSGLPEYDAWERGRTAAMGQMLARSVC